LFLYKVTYVVFKVTYTLFAINMHSLPGNQTHGLGITQLFELQIIQSSTVFWPLNKSINLLKLDLTLGH